MCVTPRILTAVFYGLLPIVSILVFGWDWRSVLLLYWFENVTAGLLNVVSMIRTKRVQPEGEAPMTFNDSTKPASRSGLVLFFIAHYGIFTLVHGIFVLLICAGVFNFLGGSIVGKSLFGDLSLVNWRGILLIWFGGTVVQLIALLLTRPDRLPAASKLFWQPYPRIIKLHITVLGGIWLIEKLGWAPAAAILLALLHLGFDLASILFERRKINAALS